ncbi:Nn.00g032210.m01.CDS01 [Neocucurbitaria sp. VM-36]
MSNTTTESALSKYRYEALFGVWLAVTGATFLRISRQPYSSGLKIEQYESIFKGTSLSAVLDEARRGAFEATETRPEQLESSCASFPVTYRTITINSWFLGIYLMLWTKSGLEAQATAPLMGTGTTSGCVSELAVPARFHMQASLHRQHTTSFFSYSPLSSTTPPPPTVAIMLLRVGSLSVEFNVWNPLYAVAPFVVFVVSIPLAIFAIMTTSLAVALLSCRALVVYFQLGVALASAWLLPALPKSSSRVTSSHRPSSSGQSSPTRQRNRRSSAVSTTSQDSATVAPAPHASRLHNKSGSFSSLIGTSEITRDFEGVGGWRVAGDEDEEALWMGINSRLQLPADAPTRRHKRSLTGGASPSQRWTWSPEAFRMSPVQSRVRTPVRFAIDDENDYFPPQSMPGMRPISSASEPTKHHRRKSGSGSSASSTSGMMMAVKEAGE